MGAGTRDFEAPDVAAEMELPPPPPWKVCPGSWSGVPGAVSPSKVTETFPLRTAMVGRETV